MKTILKNRNDNNMNNSVDMNTGVSGIAWLTVSSLTGTIVNFFLTVVLARMLSANEYGTFQAISILIGFADMLWQLGIGPALVQKININDNSIATGHTINFILGISLFIILNAFAHFWCELFSIESVEMMRVYSLVFILNTVMAVPKALMQRECNFKTLAFCSIISTITHAIIAIILAYAGMGAWALVISILVQYIVQMVIVSFHKRLHYRMMIDKGELKSLARFSGGYTLSQIFNYFALQADNYIVNRRFGSTGLGYYGKAYNLMGYPVNLLGQTISQVLFPIMSRKQNDYSTMRKVYYSSTGVMAILTLPIVCVAAICRIELVLFLLGDKWIDVVPPMLIMVLGMFFRCAYKIDFSFLRALGKVYEGAFVQFIYAVAIIVGSIIGSNYGMSGVAIGVTVGFTLMYVMSTVLTLRELKASILIMIRYLFPSVIHGGILGFSGHYFHKYLVTITNNNLAILCVFTTFSFGLEILLYMCSKKWLIPVDIDQMMSKMFTSLKNKLPNKLNKLPKKG